MCECEHTRRSLGIAQQFAMFLREVAGMRLVAPLCATYPTPDSVKRVMHAGRL